MPKAFPRAENLILDCEVLLVDTRTSTPLPFGTLGVHKARKIKTLNTILLAMAILTVTLKFKYSQTFVERAVQRRNCVFVRLRLFALQRRKPHA